MIGILVELNDGHRNAADRRPSVTYRAARWAFVLDGLGLRDRPEILVYNKLDLLPVGEGASRADEAGAIAVSALKRTGLKQLLESAELALFDEGHDADLGLGKPAWAVGGEG